MDARTRTGELLRERIDRLRDRWRARAAGDELGCEAVRNTAREYLLARRSVLDELEGSWPDAPLAAWRPLDRALDEAFEGFLGAHEASQHATPTRPEQGSKAESLLRMVGHDLRSPLSAIAGSAELLLRRDVSDAGPRRVLFRILRSVDKLDRLIGDVLDFARARFTGRIALHFEQVDLASLTGEIVCAAEAAHPGRVRFSAKAGSVVDCDRQRVAQVISALIDGAVAVASGPDPIDVELTDEADLAVLTVHAKGPPLAPERVASAFDPLIVAEPKRVDLRLYVAREIVLAHRGRLDVRTSETTGTIFSVRVPLRHAREARDTGAPVR